MGRGRPANLKAQTVAVVEDCSSPPAQAADPQKPVAVIAAGALSSGVHPKVASERLGHSKIGITLDLYSHVLPGMEADAAERVDAALQAAINKRTKTIG